MNRIKGLALGLGVATLIVVGLACGAGEKQDPAEAEPVSDAPQAQGQPGPSGSPGASPSPVIPGGAPLANLTFEGAVYYQKAFSSAEAANLNEDELELVGSTIESNTLPPGGGESLKIYRLNDGDAYQVYTLTPGTSFQNEDGHEVSTITIEPEWTRWSASSEAIPVASAPVPANDDEALQLTTDTALTAKQTGLPVESVERAIAFQQAFGKYADELIVRFPDQISAVWTEPIPNTSGHVQFTGEVPPEVTSEIEWQGLLDPNNVVLTGGGMISMADHSRRAELAAEVLADLGYRNFITFLDVIDKVIHIELQLSDGVSQPSELDLVGAVQNRVRADRDQSGESRFQGRAATVNALDLELIVITGSGPIVTLE